KLRGAPPVMPQLEMDEVDRLIKRLVGQQAVVAQRLDDAVAFLNPGVDRANQRIGVVVEIGDEVGVVAFQADALHANLVVFPGRTALADRGEQIPRQPVADVVRGAGAAEAAHVAERAGGGGEVLNRERPGGNRKSTRLNSSHVKTSYAVCCL